MSKKLAFVLSGAILIAACGNSGETKTAENKDTTAAAAPAATASSDKGLALIGASDCTTCHPVAPSQEGGASIEDPASMTR